MFMTENDTNIALTVTHTHTGKSSDTYRLWAKMAERAFSVVLDFFFSFLAVYFITLYSAQKIYS